LTFEQFRYGFANAVSEDEAKDLYEQFAVPGSGKPLFQAATANLNPWTEAKVDTHNPDRGPLLIISGEQDHTVPWAVANASYQQQQHNPGGDRDRGDEGPRPCPDHRPRLARGRRHRPGLHPTLGETSQPTTGPPSTTPAPAGLHHRSRNDAA
jgi:hypothetical protein